MIHITDGQSDGILDVITAKHIISNNHRQSLKDTLETFEFRTFADKEFSEHLGKHNRVIIPAEDQGYKEFIINELGKYRDTEGLKAEVYASASYLLLKKAKVINPTILKDQTATTAASHATNDTEWRPGVIEGKGTRTFNIEKHTNPFAFSKTIAKEFNLELHFRVETDGNKVTGRYVDLLEKIGQWRGREVEFGKDLIGIRRTEKTDNVYTALLGLGPEKEDGTRLEVLVVDKEALQRWGRPDPITGELKHLISPYEPQSTREDMTLSELRQYTQTELDKRINEVVEYESTIADLENVPGMENKKIRFGDTIKIKDTKFNPPLYLEARVHTQDRSITDKSQKTVELGDYIEYTEEEVRSIWKQMQAEIERRLARMLLINIEASAGNVFKNGEGSTDLAATVFLTGNEVDETGDFYSYYWKKFDKRGIPVPGYGKAGKTITVTSDEVDEKASYHVEISLGDGALAISRITISNVFDGVDGEQGPRGIQGETGEQGIPGPDGKDGQSLFTWVKYADSPTSGMSDSPTNKKYIGLAYNKTTATESNTYADYEWAKVEGDQGVPGPKGSDGEPRYTWVKYADDENGAGMSDSSKDKRYLGLAYNKTSATESSNAADYSWSPLYDNVVVGGRNLVLDSDRGITGDTYNIGVFSLAGKWDLDMEYTITAHANLGEGKDLSFWVNGSGGPNGQGALTEISKGVWSRTFKLRSGTPIISGTNTIHFYQTPSSSPLPFDFYRVKVEKGNIPTDWTPAPEDVDQAISDAEQNANTHANAVSEAAYIDAVNDAEDYMQANGIMQGSDYNGVSITNADGFVTARGDGLVRTVQNSVLGQAFQRRASTSAPWEDVLYFDTNGNAKYAGDLEGASGTFGEVTVLDGDFNLQEESTGLKYGATPKRNYVKDHSFELVEADPTTMDGTSVPSNWLGMGANSPYNRSPWEKYGEPKVAIQFAPSSTSALAIFGRQAIVVRDANFVRQDVYEGVTAGTQFTLSAYFKRQWNNTGGGLPRFEVRHWRMGSKLATLLNISFPAVKNDYTIDRRAVTFTVPSDFKEDDTLEIVISGGNDRWIQCDGVQLVKGDTPSVYQPEDSIWELTSGWYPIVSRQRNLWSGAVYLLPVHEVIPSKPITQCNNGWVLQWSKYNIGSGPDDRDWQYTHIPKNAAWVPGGHRADLNYLATTGEFIRKYFYISETQVTGHDSNGDGNTRNVCLRNIYEY